MVGHCSVAKSPTKHCFVSLLSSLHHDTCAPDLGWQCRSELLGCSQQMVVKQPLILTLHMHDIFGNALTHGGPLVTMDMGAPQGSNVTSAIVEDLDNGMYSLYFVPDCSGRWMLNPR